MGPRPRQHCPQDFNPRSCTRSDDLFIRFFDSFLISTHAPARGATRSISRVRLLSFYFNPRSCTRSDQSLQEALRRLKISTHAPARGATTRTASRITLTPYFNPRSCTRSDSPALPNSKCTLNFNPRSCTRSDQGYAFESFTEKISTHAPARGATWMCITRRGAES